jgi:hypothetical protein
MGLGLDNIPSLPGDALCVLWLLLVVCSHLVRLRSKARSALFKRQLHVSATLGKGEFLIDLRRFLSTNYGCSSCEDESMTIADRTPRVTETFKLEDPLVFGLCLTSLSSRVQPAFEAAVMTIPRGYRVRLEWRSSAVTGMQLGDEALLALVV